MQHPSDQLLTALGKTRVTFQTFRDRPDARGQPTILHGTLQQHHNTLAAFNKYRQGIYFMVNSGDERGRRAENVTSVSSYFADLDGTPLYDSWPLDPTAIVESSPGRYHVYWRVTDAPLATFSHVQKHIAELLAADDKVHDLPRVLRLPGFQHHKGEAFTSRLIHVDPEAAYTHQDVIDAFYVPDTPPVRRPLPPEVQSYIDRHKNRGNSPKPARSRDLDSATDRVLNAKEGDRNHTLYRVASAVAAQIREGEVSRTDAEERLKYAGLAIGLNEHEISATIRSAMRHA